MSGRTNLLAMGIALALGLGVSIGLFLQKEDGSSNGKDQKYSENKTTFNLGGSVHPGAIEGQVLNQKGVPVPKATVTPYTFTGTTKQGKSVETTADGRFRIDGLPPGRYALRASRSGHGIGVRLGVRVNKGGIHQLASPIQLQEGADVTLQVTTALKNQEAGGGLSGISVVLQQELSHEGGVGFPIPVFQTRSNEEGKAMFPAILDGKYIVRCEKDGFATNTQHFHVQDGKVFPHPLVVKLTKIN